MPQDLLQGDGRRRGERARHGILVFPGANETALPDEQEEDESVDAAGQPGLWRERERKKGLEAVAWMVVAAVAAVLAASAPAALAGEPGTLVVTGQAEVKGGARHGRLSSRGRTGAETLEEARAANAAAMNRVQERLLASGAEPRDLRTEGFSVQPEWHYNEEDGTRTLVGYRVSHTLVVTVTRLDQLGALLDAAMEEGANRVSGPTFGVRDPEALELEALREAVRRAKRKAEALAEAAGTSLAGVAEIRESVVTPYAGGIRLATAAVDAAERAGTSIAPGEVTVSATVTIVYAIDGGPGAE